MNGMNEWMPISQVSQKVNIPPETVRRYARQYGSYLAMKRGEKKAYLIHESSLDTIKRIRTLLEQGHQHGQVKLLLRNENEANVHIEKEEAEHDQKLSQQMMKEIHMLVDQNKKLMKLMTEMHERMNVYEEILEQQQQLAVTSEQVDETMKEQRDYERKRDEYLLKTMNEMQEKRKESANPREKNMLCTKLFKLS